MAVIVNEEACISCGVCVDSCAVEALELGSAAVEVDADKCIECGVCVDECAVGALSL